MRCIRLIAACIVGVAATGCRSAGPDLVVQPQDPRLVATGRAVATGLAACGACHGSPTEPEAPLSGGRLMTDKYGEVRAPNITPSRSGVGEWTTNQLMGVLRSGVTRDGRLLSPELHRGYEWMSDPDALSVVAYIRSQPPIQNEIEERELSFIKRNTTGFFDRAREVTGYVPPIAKRFGPEYGQYLVNHVARCQVCHNGPGTLFSDERYLAGGKTISFDGIEKTAPGLSGANVNGLGSWAEHDVVNYLRTSTTPSGRISDPLFCPTAYYARASEEDLLAIARYLKSLPPA